MPPMHNHVSQQQPDQRDQRSCTKPHAPQPAETWKRHRTHPELAHLSAPLSCGGTEPTLNSRTYQPHCPVIRPRSLTTSTQPRQSRHESHFAIDGAEPQHTVRFTGVRPWLSASSTPQSEHQDRAAHLHSLRRSRLGRRKRPVSEVL
jgi:hypothetical protein